MVTMTMGAEQEKRVAKAVAEGPEMQWRNGPAGWVVETKSGGCYQVSEKGAGSCSCPDFRHRCQGTELRCAHIVALKMKLAEDAIRQAPPVVADKEAEAMRIAREDAIFQKLYGNG